MNIYIVIPAHNEENTIGLTLDSLINQTVKPNKIVVVNDNSTDGTDRVISNYSNKYEYIHKVDTISSANHIPGRKVINAFNKGLETLDSEYDIICKFDADVIFPEHYLETVIALFNSDKTVGVAGGLPYIEKNGQWIFESIASKDHVRGPVKAYRKACFEAIGGLRSSIGWDSVDVLLAQYFGWTIKTDHSLHVKHLKPTGTDYQRNAKYLQGEALYKMRFGVLLTIIASLKGAIKRKNTTFFFNSLIGYFKGSNKNLEFLVTREQGKFIRNLRWKNIRKKLL